MAVRMLVIGRGRWHGSKGATERKGVAVQGARELKLLGRGGGLEAGRKGF